LKSLEIDHIGIAVKSIEESTIKYQQLLGAKVVHDEVVDHQQVNVRFLQTGAKKFELLEATSPESPITRFIEKRNEGLHHIAFKVSDIRHEMDRLKKEGFQLLQDKPIKGAWNKWVCFIHPKSIHGVLVEICQPMDV
jgi:methylmalonyl-CoA/ethylmalonyl-CoA epimerase